jgi:simple sugar transport system ATP-binding protein
VHAGELVGIAGVEGSGQRELLRLLAGRLEATSGTLERPDRVAFVPEDRHRDGLLLDGSLVENLALRGAGARHGLVPWSALAARTTALLERFDVRTGGPGSEAAARTLSGGNQQKFIVARELAGDDDAGPVLVVAENPTRGLDVRATAAVHARLQEARSAGAAVVVYSSDLDEVLALADRVLVVYDGRVRAVRPDRDVVGRAMLGADG